MKKEKLMKMTKEELVNLIYAYDRYITVNYDEMLGWAPVCVAEFYENDYESYK